MFNRVLTKALCKKWIKALRSGKYKQGRHKLRNGNQHGTRYCCLGVAEKVCKLPRNDKFELDVQDIVGLDARHQSNLIAMNDEENASFKDIADYIETNILPECPDD